MGYRSRQIGLILVGLAALAPLQAATVSQQNADSFARKIVQIQRQGDVTRNRTQSATPLRTRVTEDELNSWFTYRAQPVLPAGVSEPQLTILGEGRVSGRATVDLEAIGKRRGSGGGLDPWSYLGGRVPVTVSGILHTQNGRGRFEMQNADVSGVPVPKSLLQELVSYYSRNADDPDGVRLDDAFELPANIDKIEVGERQAVIVQ
jgi:hypothetical protein